MSLQTLARPRIKLMRGVVIALMLALVQTDRAYAKTRELRDFVAGTITAVAGSPFLVTLWREVPPKELRPTKIDWETVTQKPPLLRGGPKLLLTRAKITAPMDGREIWSGYANVLDFEHVREQFSASLAWDGKQDIFIVLMKSSASTLSLEVFKTLLMNSRAEPTIDPLAHLALVIPGRDSCSPLEVASTFVGGKLLITSRGTSCELSYSLDVKDLTWTEVTLESKPVRGRIGGQQPR
jgi:hypothetical protein